MSNLQLNNFTKFMGREDILVSNNGDAKHIIVATLALGSQPSQRFARVRATKEAQESHFMLSGVQKSVRE
jgi:hypothetical protein